MAITPKDLIKLQKIAKGGKRAATTAQDLETMAQLQALGEAPLAYTAADRARAGNKAAELIKTQPQVKASEALGNLMEKGFKKVSTTQSDRTRVGGGNIGGANFSAISEADPEYARKVWGVMDEGTASRLTNLSSPETIWTTMLGSANQLKTNPVVFDKLKKQFIAAMKEGKLSKELEAKFNHNLELTFGEGAQIRDPNIWKEADTFEKRAALADLMMGQGITPKKGGVAMGGEKSGKGVIFKPTDTLIQETEPSLLHPEHGGSVPTFALGPRLFNLSGTAEMRPDLHPGFPMLLHGEDLGYNFEPVPTEVFLPTWHKHFRDIKPERFQGPWAEEIINRRKNKSYKLKGAEGPGYYDLALGLEGEGLPSQDLHDEFIRHLIREGYAEGGEVHMAGGGDAAKAKKLMDIASGTKKVGAVSKADAALAKHMDNLLHASEEMNQARARLPMGTDAARAKIEREFAEAQAKKDALYKVEKPPVEKGNKALAEARRILSKQPPALKVKPPSDNVLNVRQSNFNHSRTIGNQTVNIDDLSGGVRLSDPNEQKRVDELASRISSPDGYISRIIVDQDNNVIEGQHRLEALRQLGVQDVPVYKIEDLEATMPVRKMEEAMSSVGSIHSDHVHQLMDHALQHISEVGLDEARKMNYGRFQPYYDAALNAIESKAHGGVVHMAEGGKPRKYVPPSQLFPLKTEEPSTLGMLSSAASNIKDAAKEEGKTFGDKGTTMDIINRGPVADVLGGFVDLANLPLQGLDYLASKIPAFSKPASVMEPEGERVSIAPVSSDEPFGGSEAWRKQFQKSGVTSMTERPLTEMAVSLASPFAPFAAGKALKAGKALAPTAGKLAQEFAESTQFGLPFELNVMKNKGGNWTTDLSSTVRDLKSNVLNETGYKNLAERAGQDVADQLRIENEPKSAINKWVDTKLVNYIKNEMGTPQDPIRVGIERRASEVDKLRETHQKRVAKMEADIEKAKAEGKNTRLSERDLAATKEKLDEEYQIASRGLSHMTAPEEGWNNPDRWIPETHESVKGKRQVAGFPREGIASHPASQAWENTADESIGFNRVSDYTTPSEFTGNYSMNQQSTLAQNPWLHKVAEKNPNEFAYRVGTPLFLHNTEFNHMIDELGEALNPTSKLPKNLKISPKDLEKMTVDDVSALSGKISAWREIQKVKSDIEIANNPATHTFKEYTENNPKGVSWKQIKRPEGYSDEEAEKFVRAATQYEGDVMRHCVGGAGHCDPLLNDEVEIYSLRDAKGEPHVTIEVEKGINAPAFYEKNRELLESPELQDDHFEINNSTDNSAQYIKRITRLLDEHGYVEGKDYFIPEPKAPIIREIKGKGNKKPNDEYIPFIQDFIKSGEWSEINDIKNAEIKHARDALGIDTYNKLKANGVDVPKYLDVEDAIKFEHMLYPDYFNDPSLPELTRKNYIENWRQTYASGGAVQSPNGFDYESHVNNIMNAHNASNFDYEGHVKKIMGMANGGAAYNTQPDMSDGGLSIPAPAFKIGGRIPLLTR